MDLKGQLAGCFCRVRLGKVLDRVTVFFRLIVHLLLGFCDLRHDPYYEGDPLFIRILGLHEPVLW